MAFTNSLSKIYVCSTPQNSDLTLGDYELLSWVLVGSVGNLGETGKSTNIVTYNTWDNPVAQKAKGITDAGSPTLEVAYNATDPGQEILRSCGEDNNVYAFKIVRANAVNGGIGTVEYNRGLVSGPTRPNGGNEDFVKEVFTLALVQKEIVVKPTSGGNPPVLEVAPAITGTEAVGEILTCSTGTFSGDATITYTYQWFVDGVAKVDSTLNTYNLTSSDVGKVLFCRVRAENDAGSAFGFSNTTGEIV